MLGVGDRIRKLSQMYFIGTFLPLIVIRALYKSFHFSSPLERRVKSKGLIVLSFKEPICQDILHSNIIVLSCSECVLKCNSEKVVLGISMGWRKSQWFFKKLPSEFERVPETYNGKFTFKSSTLSI